MDANDAITKHLLENRDHEISVCMNVQHGGPEQLRVTINKLQRPYRPKLLGVYVVDTVQEALAKLPAPGNVETKVS